MTAYSIFDDFPQSAIAMLEGKGIKVSCISKGEERPFGDKLKSILHKYDIIFISTGQKMPEAMFQDIVSPKIIATASSGTDHIHVPQEKKDIIRVANAPNANRLTVAEHTYALILALRKCLIEARKTAANGDSKKAMKQKPRDLYGCTIGVIGAGAIAEKIFDIADCFGMKKKCWTLHPERHLSLKEKHVEFIELDELMATSDIVSVNMPFTDVTKNLVSEKYVKLLKSDSIFVSTSRVELLDLESLINKAKCYPSFGLALDLDAQSIASKWKDNMNNVIITPHIAGGTVESRIRLFNECCQNAINLAYSRL